MFINNMERKYGKYAIKNLTLYLIVTYAVGFVINNMVPELYGYLVLDPHKVFNGEVWRIFTWVLTTTEDNILFLLIMLIFYYSIGNILENTWGAFKYNVYIFSGLLLNVIGAFVLYGIMLGVYRQTGDDFFMEVFIGDEYKTLGIPIDIEFAKAMAGEVIGVCITTYYIALSIFLAYAATFSESVVMLYAIIPIKVKWMGYVYAALIAYSFFQTGWGYRVVIIISLLNFFIFFFTTRKGIVSPANYKRKQVYVKKVREANKSNVYENGARHKCAICGRTDIDFPELTFRYCSKCTGGKEYCQEHLFTHTHN